MFAAAGISLGQTSVSADYAGSRPPPSEPDAPRSSRVLRSPPPRCRRDPAHRSSPQRRGLVDTFA
ncbi:MAG: hypothetical protein MZW92_52505 [Comamonadaceae bacterium]|nr:hypothetical protein [Comamonadaceae bacterium]